MPVFSLHEHDLKPDADITAYERDVGAALQRMRIPGLLKVHQLKGFKGERKGLYAVLWVFENQAAINENFGTSSNPKWPADWLYYENVILAKYLTVHPDKIHFTDYAVIAEVNF